jgi:transcriptional regulator with XRE-family HTH domain
MKNARAIREARNESMYDVHLATGITPGSLSRFETSDSMLRYPALVKLATHYRCSIEDLVKEVVPA